MTTRKKPSTGLQQARERAADELNLPLSDHRVERLAKLVIADEAMQSLLAVAPERVDFGKMLDVDQALAALRQELKRSQPMGLDVHLVESLDTQECPQCKHRFELAKVRRTLEEAQHAARERAKADLQNAVAQPADSSAPSSPPSCTDLVPGAGQISTGRTPPPNVVELKRPSIHDPVVFGDGTKLNPPLKRLEPREAWQGYPLPTV